MNPDTKSGLLRFECLILLDAAAKNRQASPGFQASSNPCRRSSPNWRRTAPSLCSASKTATNQLCFSVLCCVWSTVPPPLPLWLDDIAPQLRHEPDWGSPDGNAVSIGKNNDGFIADLQMSSVFALSLASSTWLCVFFYIKMNRFHWVPTSRCIPTSSKFL